MEKEDKYPSFDFNFKKIKDHIKTLPDYESARNYLEHVEAQFDFLPDLFLKNCFREMGLEEYLCIFETYSLCKPIPERSEKGEKIIDKLIAFARTEFGLYEGALLEQQDIEKMLEKEISGEWTAYDDDSKSWYFTSKKIYECFKKHFQAEYKVLDWLMHRGRFLQREEAKNGPGTAKSKSGTVDSYKYKLFCPKDKLDTVNDIFSELKDEATLKLSENFDVEDYFSCKRKEEKTDYILERSGIEFTEKNLHLIVALVEILEEKCGVESQPVQIRETFRYPGGKKINTGPYGNYKRSKITPKNAKSRSWRFSINDRKDDLLKILSAYI